MVLEPKKLASRQDCSEEISVIYGTDSTRSEQRETDCEPVSAKCMRKPIRHGFETAIRITHSHRIR